MGILRDGIGIRISIPGMNVTLYGEIEVTPPGVTGRGPIDMTGTRNAGWETMTPKSIKKLTPMNAKLMFDPQFIPAAWAIVQKNGQFTVTFPNGAVLIFWAWLEEVNPDPQSEGNRPTLNVVIQPSNLNSQCVETGPSWTAGSYQPCA